MGKKPPAFQFYPSDWKSDLELQSCSLEAKGLWIELICIMHEATPYGHLALNNRPLTDQEVAKLVGINCLSYRRLTRELLGHKVARLNGRNIIYSKRMVDDHKLRKTRQEAGKKGGNPRILLNQIDNQKVNHLVNQGVPPPSSSSSSSISSSLKKTLTSFKGERVEIINYLNQKTDSSFKPDSKSSNHITARLKEGFTVDDCKLVIDNRVDAWINDPERRQYLRPQTLFNAEKFEGYLQDAKRVPIKGEPKAWQGIREYIEERDRDKEEPTDERRNLR